MANRFFTLMLVPEKTQQVKKIIIPAWALRGALVATVFAVIIAAAMIFDYWYVMSQVGENKRLKLENRRLKQQVQVFKNKMATLESTIDRVKTFSTRLKVITNIEDQSGLIERLNNQLPDAAQNIHHRPPIHLLDPESDLRKQLESAQARTPSEDVSKSLTETVSEALGIPEGSLPTLEDPESAQLRRDYEELDSHFSRLNNEAFLVEQILQDQYELLADQKAFLAALPTRKPVVGYFTSGFGVRKSPYGGRVKMHEGLDIANHPGTPIRAPADGVVVFARAKAGYGRTVIIDHGYGLETWYGHTRKIMVRKGEKVRRGDAIALLGSSGRSTGPHLHYEVRVHGTPVDPLTYVLEE